ncbi:DUF4235 domain-containing protein [Micrococcus sp.]|uniref:DUF4235 domain-containing protein n=1 Tax=Micrococcus sp. TaxID=1271 RepID=UPI0026DAD2D0|nr:DUF4235 domain-containing protein [Micrococcus sp.]MDO4240263.1 DUF4235 domain-containing protein [Micrococcus sp.]
MEKLVQKILATGVTVVGGIVASRLVAGGWKLVTGHDAPSDATDETVPLVEALAFTFASAGIASVLKVAGQRAAADGVRRIADKTGKRVDNEV